MGSGLNWDRARQDRLRTERGTEPVDLPSPGSVTRKPAPQAQLTAAVTQWRTEFARLSYHAQLAYLTDLRRRLRRLNGSDDQAAQTIATQFKPLLRLPRKALSAPAAAPPASLRGGVRPLRRETGQTTEKRMPCAVCGKRFATTEAVRSHTAAKHRKA